MTGAPGKRRRILIGAGSFADARAALLLLDRLSAARKAELFGLFLEETVLAEIAGLPAQRVVTLGGDFAVMPSHQQLRELAEREARAFRGMLSDVAGGRKWRFETRRGEMVTALGIATESWDIALLGHRESHPFARQVILIVPPANASQQAADLARELAAGPGAGLRSLSLASHGDAGSDMADVERVESEDALFARVARIPAAALVLDLSAGPLTSHRQLRDLLAAARCPVIVLGAAMVGAGRKHEKRMKR